MRFQMGSGIKIVGDQILSTSRHNCWLCYALNNLGLINKFLISY